MAARPIADPVHLFDCVMPCAGAEAFLVCRADKARSLGLDGVRMLATIERHNAFPEDPMQIRGGWAQDVGEMWPMAGVKPDDVDLLETYDDYPVIVTMQFEDLGFCKKGEGAAFVRAHTFTRTARFRTIPRAASSRSDRPAPPAAISDLLKQCASSPESRSANRLQDAKVAVVSGFGMINYDRGLSSGAAVLARA